MIGMVDIIEFATAPPAFAVLILVLALNILCGVSSRSRKFSGFVFVPEGTRPFEVGPSPTASAFKMFFIILLIPSPPILGYPAFVECVVALLIGFVALWIILSPFSRIFSVLFFSGLPIKTYLLQSFFSIRIIVFTYNFVMFLTVFSMVVATISATFFAVIFSPLFLIIASFILVICGVASSIFTPALGVLRIAGSAPRPNATLAFSTKSVATGLSPIEEFGGCGVFLAAYATNFCGSIHSILTHADLTCLGQSGGVSAAFPVAIGRLPISIIP